MTKAGFVSWTRQHEQPGQQGKRMNLLQKGAYFERRRIPKHTVHCILYTRSTPGDRPTDKDHFRRTIISDSRMFQNQECTSSSSIACWGLRWLYEYICFCWGWVVVLYVVLVVSEFRIHKQTCATDPFDTQCDWDLWDCARLRENPHKIFNTQINKEKIPLANREHVSLP